MTAIAIDQVNLQTSKFIINHDIMNCTADGVLGNHLYSGRALGISEPWDLIQLHPDLKPLWEAISRHYKRIGLSHSDNVIWGVNLCELGSHIGYQPSVFYFGPEECHYWGDREWLDTVEYINSKNNFMALAKQLGVDVPQTLCFGDVEAIDKDILKGVVYPCYLKAAVSVSGVGIYRCQNEAELLTAITKFDTNVPVQLQEEVCTNTFLNMQYRVVGKDVYRLVCSAQILDGFVHQGNQVPTQYEPWDVVDPMAEWLKDHGMQGIFAFDVAVVETDNGARFPAIECNPRYNGASYPTLIAQKLGIPQWSSVTLSTHFRTLSDIDLSDIEYDKKTGEGVVIVNWGTVLVGKLVVLLAGSLEYQEVVLAELKTRI